MQDGHKTKVDSNKGSSHGERSVSYVPERSYRSELDQEIENLRKQVKEQELERRGQRQRKDREESSSDPNFTGGSTGESSH